MSIKVNRPLACGLFIFYPASACMVVPHGNNSVFSYTSILSYTTDTILPYLGYSPQSLCRCYAPPLFWQEISTTKVNRPLACGLFCFCIRPSLCWPFAHESKFIYTTTLSHTLWADYPRPGRMLFLVQEQHHPWLWIICPLKGCSPPPSLWQEMSSQKG